MTKDTLTIARIKEPKGFDLRLFGAVNLLLFLCPVSADFDIGLAQLMLGDFARRPHQEILGVSV